MFSIVPSLVLCFARYLSYADFWQMIFNVYYIFTNISVNLCVGITLSANKADSTVQQFESHFTTPVESINV